MAMKVARTLLRHPFALASLIACGIVAASLPPTLRLGAQPGVVTIAGDVRLPGEYSYEDGLTAGAVVEKAGGISGESVRKITVMRLKAGSRATGSANPDTIAATITQIQASSDTALVAGDTLQVSAYKTDFVAPGAQRIVAWIAKGEFDNVTLTYFGPARPATFEAALQKQWLALEKQLGVFQQQTDVRIEVRGIQYAGIVSCAFARGRGDVTVIFNRDGTVNDLSMTAVTP
jgi:hypothetical protein